MLLNIHFVLMNWFLYEIYYLPLNTQPTHSTMKPGYSIVRYPLIYLLISLWLMPFTGFATHQRAGEITYRHISGLTYEATIITYTYAPSSADRCELIINWGDGESDILVRTNGPPGTTPANIYCPHVGELITPEIRYNVYVGTHTYAAPSTYIIWLEDPNRNLGIQNIPNSVDVPLYIESQLVVNPFLGGNTSPQLLLPPIDNGCVGTPYLHNAGAYDPDGDSLSYKLVICKGANGNNIPGYKFPNEVEPSDPGLFTINSITGDILWDSPSRQGEYNFAFIIEEWRNGIRVGYVTRDMQVNILACNNHPPILTVNTDTCVIAGDTLRLKVSATDEDNDRITLTADGGPLLLPVSPAQWQQPDDSAGRVSAVLVWPTVCAHIRNNPYQLYFKATDNGSPVKLFDLKTANITVIAPPVKNPAVIPLGNTMVISWDLPPCLNASGYKIYRRTGSTDFYPEVCQTGVPPETGFSLIATTNSINNPVFIDDNNSFGLVRGVQYCYRITYWFDDGSESITSEEVCASLKKDLPVITNVNVLSTSEDNGEIEIVWSKPTELDTIQTPGPYIYRLFRSAGFGYTSPIEIASFTSLDDTIYMDTGLNTKTSAHTYALELINNTPGNVFSIGFTPPASSVFLTASPTDEQINLSVRAEVPWLNSMYVFYRKNDLTGTFDSIGISTTPVYSDTGLINDQEYCYKAVTLGSYGTPGYIDPIINASQEQCASPVDNVPPCAVTLLVEVECDARELLFRWNDLSQSCAPDVKRYYLYEWDNPHRLIESFPANVFNYVYKPMQTIAGCFFMVAEDEQGNMDTTNYTRICTSIDDCPRYRLPNVFTPNNDTYNDYLVPFPGYTSVERIDLQIFNRWGVMVFQTLDPAIMWDGKDKNTNKPCAEGVYFYTCDVFEVTGSSETPGEKIISKRSFSGSIHLLR